MAVNANTVETYDNSLIREDLREQYYTISPEEVPFQTAVGTGPDASNTYHEWSVLELAAPDKNNRVIEGEDAPGTDEGMLAKRRGNYCQISDVVVSVSHTNEAVDAAAYDIQKITKQMALHARVLKLSMEKMLLMNVAASAGSSGTARTTAGFPAFLRTNVIAGAGSTDPTLSDTDEGYPNAAAADDTLHGFAEEDLNDLMQDVWEAGGNPTMGMTNATNKRILTQNFTGYSTQYKDRMSRQLVNAVDVYTSDFGEISIVPNRFQPFGDETPAGGTTTAANFFLIDPDYASVSFLDHMKNKELAETGHSYKRLIWCEYCLVVENEAAHGIIRDLNGTFDDGS